MCNRVFRLQPCFFDGGCSVFFSYWMYWKSGNPYKNLIRTCTSMQWWNCYHWIRKDKAVGRKCEDTEEDMTTRDSREYQESDKENLWSKTILDPALVKRVGSQEFWEFNMFHLFLNSSVALSTEHWVLHFLLHYVPDFLPFINSPTNFHSAPSNILIYSKKCRLVNSHLRK